MHSVHPGSPAASETAAGPTTAPPRPHMGSQWADPATLLWSQPQRAKCHGWAPASHFVCRHNVLQAPAVVKGDRDRVIAWWLFHRLSPWLCWFEGLLQLAPTLALSTESRSDCFWTIDLKVLTVHLFLPLCPCCRSSSFGGFARCFPVSHPDLGGRFIFTPHQTQSP